MGHENIVAHPDFDRPWCREVLADPNLQWTKQTHEQSKRYEDGRVTNTMFEYTLYSDRGIRAHITFQRPCKESDSIFPWEQCFLLSVGDGVDGATGRAHGGFNSLVLDHISGHSAHYAVPNDLSPATATLTTDYKAPISTPCVILARGWIIELSGRKVWVRSVIEDGNGKVLAMGKALFIGAREPKL